MSNQFGFKDFETVRLKATYNMKVGDRTFDPGEPIVTFESVQIARIAEEMTRVSANGGFNNAPRVFWTTTKDERIDFSQGVFSRTQFSFLTNSRLVELKKDLSTILVTKEEYLESSATGNFTLKEEPVGDFWVYNRETGAKIRHTIDGKTVSIENEYTDVYVVYNYNYVNGAENYLIGQRLTEGFLELEGKTRVKDDTTGKVVTGILKVPKLKLMSNLSITLGAQAKPVVGNFSALAFPVGSRGNTYVSEFYILNDCID